MGPKATTTKGVASKRNLRPVNGCSKYQWTHFIFIAINSLPLYFPDPTICSLSITFPSLQFLEIV